MNTFSKSQARLSILSEIIAMGAIDTQAWQNGFAIKPKIGDLVSLIIVDTTKWYVSWVVDIDQNNGDPKYLLESIEDGELGWWENIGLNIYNRDRVKERPMWRWNDEQYAFYKTWLEVGAKNLEHRVVPEVPVFGEKNKVTLNARIRWDRSGFEKTKTFENWRRLTTKEMDNYLKETVNDYKEFNGLNADAKS